MTNPSLLIVPDRFKASKLYSQLPQDGSGDFVVTRATTAYRTNAAGILESVANNVPRLNFPIGGGCPALLVEPAATNLVLRSEEFNDAYWIKSDATISANATVAPDGTTTADKIVESLTISQHKIGRTIGLSTAAHTFSVFAKAGGRNFIQLRGVTNTALNATAFFNLSNGTVGTTANATASIENFGNGWYRCVLVVASANASGFEYEVRLSTDGIAISYLGDGTSGIFLWGAQLETGSVATSYIPTVAATATRNADVINKTAVSGLIGQTEGTLYAEVDVRNWNSGDRILSISDGTTNNSVALQKGTATNTLRLISRLSNVLQVTIQSSTISGTIFKIAAAYALNDFVLYANGVQIGVNTSASVPACSDVFLGKVESTATTNQLNDRIRAAALYTTRLSNAQLQFLTTL
jgi:hypothetical protein